MTEDQPDITQSILQNIRGVEFFLVSFCTFSGLQGTLATFSGEKPMFLRERFSNTYTTWSYFWARSLANLPFELIYPSIPVVIVFYGIGMNNNRAPDNFLLMLLIINALYFCAASYGLFYSAVIPKLEVAMALVPVLIIPFMMLSGFFRDLDQVSKVFYPLEYLSPFRYGFQASMLNEFTGKPYRKDLENSYIPNSLEANLYILLGLGVFLRFIAFVMMYYISNPKRPKINRPVV